MNQCYDQPDDTDILGATSETRKHRETAVEMTQAASA